MKVAFKENAVKEIWKDIPEYEGLYKVSNMGNIKNVGYYRNGVILKRERMMTPWLGTPGYLEVSLRKDLKTYRVFVHRAVALAFISNSENKEQVNHKDGNKLNNNSENLEWVTNSENSVHAFEHGSNVRGEKCSFSKLNEFQVRIIKHCFNLGMKII